MDDLIELVLDIFEGIFNGILNSRSVPKIIKYILVILFSVTHKLQEVISQ